MTPWLLVVLMVFAVARLTRLAVKDDFPPVLWLRDRVAGGWRPMTPGELAAQGTGKDRVETSSIGMIDGKQCRYVRRQSWSPQWLADLASCSWCASGWISGAVTAVVDLTIGIPAPWLVGVAVWSGAALLAAKM